MYFSLLIIVLLLVITILLATGVIRPITTSDLYAPLNFVMFQPPNTKYTDKLVNLWVEKSWRSDGKRIPCRVEEGYPSDTLKSERTLVLYSHGNAEDILNCVQFTRELSNTLHVDVMCWDYSGYGLNDADAFERTSEGINVSLQAIWDHMVNVQGYKPCHIILWGYSLGSGPSVQLSKNLCQTGTPPAGLVLFGAYSSILDVVQDMTHKKLSSLFEERWDSKTNIVSVTCPILLLHGQSDGLIHYRHAEILKENSKTARLVLLPNTGHTCFSWGEAIKEVRRWFQEERIHIQ